MVKRLVTLIMLMYCLELGKCKLDIFSRNRSLDNNVCFGDAVLLVYKVSEKTGVTRCLMKCSANKACRSVFYDLNSGQCVGCKYVYTATDNLTGQTGMQYYLLETVPYGHLCYPGDPCAGSNMVCWSDTCICQLGYSYEYQTGTCVDYCETYGTSFTRYPNLRIRSLNVKRLDNVTADECKEDCITRTCYAIEYKHTNLNCHLSIATPLSHPENLEMNDNYDYYTRNCEE